MFKSALTVMFGGCLVLGGAFLGADPQVGAELDDVSAAVVARVGQAFGDGQQPAVGASLNAGAKVAAGSGVPCSGETSDTDGLVEIELDTRTDAADDDDADAVVEADLDVGGEGNGFSNLITLIIDTIGLGHDDESQPGDDGHKADLDLGADVDVNIDAGLDGAADATLEADAEVDLADEAPADVEAGADLDLDVDLGDETDGLLNIDLGDGGLGLDCLCP